MIAGLQEGAQRREHARMTLDGLSNAPERLCLRGPETLFGAGLAKLRKDLREVDEVTVDDEGRELAAGAIRYLVAQEPRERVVAAEVLELRVLGTTDVQVADDGDAGVLDTRGHRGSFHAVSAWTGRASPKRAGRGHAGPQRASPEHPRSPRLAPMRVAGVQTQNGAKDAAPQRLRRCERRRPEGRAPDALLSPAAEHPHRRTLTTARLTPSNPTPGAQSVASWRRAARCARPSSPSSRQTSPNSAVGPRHSRSATSSASGTSSRRVARRR